MLSQSMGDPATPVDAFKASRAALFVVQISEANRDSRPRKMMDDECERAARCRGVLLARSMSGPGESRSKVAQDIAPTVAASGPVSFCPIEDRLSAIEPIASGFVKRSRIDSFQGLDPPWPPGYLCVDFDPDRFCSR